MMVSAMLLRVTMPSTSSGRGTPLRSTTMASRAPRGECDMRAITSRMKLSLRETTKLRVMTSSPAIDRAADPDQALDDAALAHDQIAVLTALRLLGGLGQLDPR